MKKLGFLALIERREIKEAGIQLQEEKNKFSEMVIRASTDSPQTITLHWKPAAVLISTEEYKKLARANESFTPFFKRSLCYRVDLDLGRSNDFVREVYF
jgi:prevent-host-death family protein